MFGLSIALYHPSECSVAAIVGLILVAHYGGGAVNLDPVAKYCTLQDFKNTLRGVIGETKPEVIIAKYPDTAAYFRREYPLLYAAAYTHGDEPFQNNLSAVDLSLVTQSIPMRKTRTGVSHGGCGADGGSTLQLSRSPHLQSPPADPMMAMMQTMQSMVGMMHQQHQQQHVQDPLNLTFLSPRKTTSPLPLTPHQPALPAAPALKPSGWSPRWSPRQKPNLTKQRLRWTHWALQQSGLSKFSAAWHRAKVRQCLRRMQWTLQQSRFWTAWQKTKKRRIEMKKPAAAPATICKRPAAAAPPVVTATLCL